MIVAQHTLENVIGCIQIMPVDTEVTSNSLPIDQVSFLDRLFSSKLERKVGYSLKELLLNEFDFLVTATLSRILSQNLVFEFLLDDPHLLLVI